MKHLQLLIDKVSSCMKLLNCTIQVQRKEEVLPKLGTESVPPVLRASMTVVSCKQKDGVVRICSSEILGIDGDSC